MDTGTIKKLGQRYGSEVLTWVGYQLSSKAQPDQVNPAKQPRPITSGDRGFIPKMGQ
ncbi:MAG: hypothetical protein H6940_13175 [Burkholderiales bacterium]|nr:hypothetical protein [Burkholderiales bacterium]